MRWLVWAVALLIVLAIAYPLSSGPIAYWMVRGWITFEAYEAAYAPLHNLLQCTPFYTLAERYSKWWVDL